MPVPILAKPLEVVRAQLTKGFRALTVSEVNLHVSYSVKPPNPLDFADVTALLASVSVSTVPSGRPPTDKPVTVPLPLIVIGII